MKTQRDQWKQCEECEKSHGKCDPECSVMRNFNLHEAEELLQDAMQFSMDALAGSDKEIEYEVDDD